MNGNFVIYLIGYIIVIIGVAYGMSAAGLGSQWIVPAVLVLVGLGIVWALSRSQRDTATRQRSSTPQQSSQVQSSPSDQGSSGHSGSGSTSSQSPPR